MATTTARLVREALADDGAELCARVAELEGDVVVYRDLLQRALAHAHEQHLEIQRARQQLAHLREELRRYTAGAVLARREAA